MNHLNGLAAGYWDLTKITPQTTILERIPACRILELGEEMHA
jgi:hypothetical protein